MGSTPTFGSRFAKHRIGRLVHVEIGSLDKKMAMGFARSGLTVHGAQMLVPKEKEKEKENIKKSNDLSLTS